MVLPGCAFSHPGRRPLPLPLRLLRRMAAQHLLCQTRPALVRVGLPLPYSRRAGDRAVYPAAAGVAGADAHAGSMAQDGTYALALLCVAVHMAYLLPIGGDHFEYRPLDFYWPLLAVPAAEGIALLGFRISAGLRRFPRVPGSPAWGSTCTIALFLPMLFYANAIQGVLLFEGAALREQDNNSAYRTQSRERGLAAGRARHASARRHLQRPAPPVYADNWGRPTPSSSPQRRQLLHSPLETIRTDGATFHPR